MREQHLVLNSYINTKNGKEIIKAYKRLHNIIKRENSVNSAVKYKCNKKLFSTTEEATLHKEAIYQKCNIKSY